MSTVCTQINKKILEMGKTRIVTLPPVCRGETPAVACCGQCEGELYQGEDYFRIDGQTVCADCLPRFAEEYFGFCRITGGKTRKL